MPGKLPENTEIKSCAQNEIFKSEDEMNQSISRLCYGDLYIIGRLWIETLKSGLVGSKWSLIPMVEAAKPPPPPEKPPLMRYKDLPLYKSPHYEYKDYIADKDKCPKANVKLVQEKLYPHVRAFRRSLQESCCEVSCEFKSMKRDICCALRKKKNNFVCYMRDSKNLEIRQGFVTIGGIVGLYAARSKGLPTKFFFTGLGLLATGALCFPKETDDAFRSFTYYSGKSAIFVYNFYCNKVFGLRERLPCPDEMPTPQYTKPNVCPKK